MIKLELADLVVGVEAEYNLSRWARRWLTDKEPDFTVRVAPEELAVEDQGRGLAPEYLEFICAYRHIAERLPDYDAFVFHSAVVALEDRAYLFTAPSGTGKTTHIRQWLERYPESWILNGDKPIIRRFADGFYACGTPWRGKERRGAAERRPIGGVCLLRRGAEDRIAPVLGREITPALMRQVYLPKDPARLTRFLGLFDEFCRSQSFYTMECTISHHAAELARETMAP